MRGNAGSLGVALIVSSCCLATAARSEDHGDKKQLAEAQGLAQIPGQIPAPSPGKTATPTTSLPRQARYPATPGTRITVAPGTQYRAGGLHVMLLGRHYRRAWATPVEVDVLDLGSFAGGLKPLKRGGGKQTMSLTFEAADGRRFKFRSIDKDPRPALPPELRDTMVVSLLQDQTSASLPGAPLVADGLSAAAGIPYVEHTLVVLPDDEAMGEFRETFGGRLGLMEQVVDEGHPLPAGFDGVTKVVDSLKVIERVNDDPKERIDVGSYLRGRLFDIFLGDWDRHMDQWEWMQRGDGDRWHAVPKDRDFAFSHFDGLLPGLVKGQHPTFQRFTPTYSPIVGLATNSRILDRRLLSGVELGAYMETARGLQKALTDDAIVKAVQRLPGPWYRLDGQRLIATLKSRRTHLLEAAEAFYRLLAGEVALYGTSADESVDVRTDESGALQVVVRNEGDAEPLLQRRFKPSETREVRFYLEGGDDRLATQGTADNPIRVRMAGGPGDDVLDDSQGGRSQLFDHDGKNTLVKGRGSVENDNYWVQPLDSRGYPMRDWGSSNSISPWLTAGGDLGLLGGLQFRHTDYGFHRVPYASTQSFRVGYSTARTGFKAEYVGDFLNVGSYRRTRLRARVSDVELVRFLGFGNQTSSNQIVDFYKADQREYLFAPSFRLGLKTLGVWLGAVVKFEDTKPNPGRFLDIVRPYGIEDFGEVGPQLTILIDTRNSETTSRRGLLLRASGVYYPEIWNVDQQFGVTDAELNTYLTPVRPVTLALRAGGKKVWGSRFPFFESAFIGGPDSVRGLRRDRYAGDASAFGSAELRLRLGRVKVVVPMEVGVFGFGDIGRVFVDGQTSDLWHTGMGGGLSLAVVRPENTLSLSVAWPGTLENGRFTRLSGDEAGPRIYLTGGFTF